MAEPQQRKSPELRTESIGFGLVLRASRPKCSVFSWAAKTGAAQHDKIIPQRRRAVKSCSDHKLAGAPAPSIVPGRSMIVSQKSGVTLGQSGRVAEWQSSGVQWAKVS